eukprot:SAG22_NODE_3905_length_1475_cov_1.091570_2_plen_75_part_00
MCLSVCLSVYLSVCLPVCLSICLSVLLSASSCVLRLLHASEQRRVEEVAALEAALDRQTAELTELRARVVAQAS